MLYSCIPIWQQSASKGWLLCGCSLATPGLRYIGPICIRFTYHMLGGGVGSLLVYTRFHGGPSNPLFNKTDQLCWCTGGSTEDLQTRSSTRRVSSVTAGSKQPLMQYSSTPKVYVASSTSLILNICNRCYLSDQVPETLTRT